MPLLPNQNNQQQPQQENQQQQTPVIDTSVPKPPALVQPAQPVKDEQPQQPQQIQRNAPVQKGSGFTNLNRIMQANRGSNVGGKLAQGVQGQTQNYQQNLQKSQQSFEQEANKNRLDTPEAAAKRANVLGRFDESQYQVYDSRQPQQPVQTVQAGLAQDMTGTTITGKAAGTSQTQPVQAIQQAQPQKGIDLANFKLDEKVQADYNQKKAAQQAALEATKQNYSSKLDQVQKQFDIQNTAYANLMDQIAKLESAPFKMGKGGVNQNKVTANNLRVQAAQVKASLDSIAGLRDALASQSTAEQKKVQGDISSLDEQFANLTKAEQDKWVQSERDRIMASNLPTEEEMNEFRRYQTGTYTGPKELQDLAALTGKAAQVESLGGLSRTTGGQEELLKQFLGRTGYTQGQRGLDVALLGQDKSGAASLTKAARATRGAEEQLARENLIAQGKATDYVNKAAQFGEETRKQIGETRSGLSGKIDQQLAALKNQETIRQENTKAITDMLTGANPQYGSYSNISRLGMALDQAQKAGYLSKADVASLTAKGGLIERASNLGLDPNALIAERIKSSNAVGADRAAAATSDQEARIAALDRLSGKIGTDVEFGGQPTSQYQAGKTGVDIDSLIDYISKTEGERLKSSQYAQQYQQAGLTPLQQLMAGAGQITGITGTTSGAAALGTLGAGAGLGAYGALAAGAPVTAAGLGAGAGAMGPVALAAMLGVDLLTGGDATAQAAQGAVNMGAGAAKLGTQATGNVYDALLKLKIGNSALADNDVGKQLLALNKFAQEQQNKAIDTAASYGSDYASGLSDLTKTNRIDQAFAKLSGFDSQVRLGKDIANTAGNAINQVGRAIGTAFGGGKTGNWATHELGTVDVNTGKAVRFGDFANKDSDYILNQILNQQLSDMSHYTDKSKYGSADQRLNLLKSYYMEALKREGKI